MAKVKQTAGRDQLGGFAPMFAELNDDVLFGEVWSDETLSLKMRSALTITTLVAKGLVDASFEYHIITAKKNGVTAPEMAAMLTHVAFYAGWPNAWAAFRVAVKVYTDDPQGLQEPEAHGGVFGLGQPNDAYAQYFTGRSYLNALTDPKATQFVANVTFEPGCRNNWHIHHNAAQVLIAVGGCGYYQIEGQEPKELKAGQAVCIPADTKHWHGAAPGESCSHLAFMVPAGDPASMSNEWLEPVDAEAYGKLA